MGKADNVVGAVGEWLDVVSAPGIISIGRVAVALAFRCVP